MTTLEAAGYSSELDVSLPEQSRLPAVSLRAVGDRWGRALRHPSGYGPDAANDAGTDGDMRPITQSRLSPICDAILGMMNAGELFEGRQYRVPLPGRLDGMTLMLSITGIEKAQQAKERFHSGGLRPRQLRKVIDHIRSNIAETLSLPALAALVHLSQSHFTRAFKVSVGETPHAHVLRLRIEAAMAMMVKTDEPLAEIAVACGFSDQSHFTRRFHCLVGTSPSRWRRTQHYRICSLQDTSDVRLGARRDRRRLWR